MFFGENIFPTLYLVHLQTMYHCPCIPVKLPWIFPEAPLNFNGAPGNIQGIPLVRLFCPWNRSLTTLGWISDCKKSLKWVSNRESIGSMLKRPIVQTGLIRFLFHGSPAGSPTTLNTKYTTSKIF